MAIKDETVNPENLDSEWIKLIVEAKNLGITTEEIHEFFLQNAREEFSTTNT